MRQELHDLFDTPSIIISKLLFGWPMPVSQVADDYPLGRNGIAAPRPLVLPPILRIAGYSKVIAEGPYQTAMGAPDVRLGRGA